MTRLPEDVIIEIFVRTPVKSLLCFRCVCKSWYDLIKSPNFIKKHLEYHQTVAKILIIRGHEIWKKHFMSLHSYESLSIISTRFQIPFESNSFKISEPCNGLLCLSFEETIILCNPSLRKFKALPPPPFHCPHGWVYHVMAIGFGFVSNRIEYQVITIVDLRRMFQKNVFKYKSEIYNMGTNSWREILHDHELPRIDYTSSFGTLFNEAFHWIAESHNSEHILSLDMKTEMFQDMKIPENDLEGRTEKFLTVLNESLALLVYSESRYEPQFVAIWVMSQYNVAESWTKQFNVGPVFGIRCPLLWKNESVILESDEGRLVSCNINSHEMNDLEIHGFRDTLRVMVYQESLLSVN